MRDWRVAVKLAAVLTIPLMGFLVVAGVQVTSSVGTASSLDKFSKQVALGREVTALVHDLQRERDRSAGMLAALGARQASTDRDIAGLAPEWTAVDRAVEAFRHAASPLLSDEAVAQAYAQADAMLGELKQLRDGAGQGWLRTQASFDTYTKTIASLQALLPVPVQVGGDADVARIVRGFTNLSLAKELTAQIRGHLYIVCVIGAFDPGESERIADVRAESLAAIERFREDADQAQLKQFDDAVTGQAVSNAGRLLQTIISNARAAELGVEAQQWWLASTTQLELMREVEVSLLANATSVVEGASGKQWSDTIAGSLATLALLLVAVVTSIAIGRRMAFSLRSLREQALQIAHHQLPSVIGQLRAMPTKAPPIRVEPIVVRVRDEVGEVAEAFTAVHRSAVRLAAEQANMRRNVNEIFIKLARRSQALVERQLRLLDTMESAETDPDQLSKLFRLDHLATRLRRNDENLLVLAEGDSTRGWSQPVDLNTVALAATAEIERYTMIQPEIVDSVYIVGYAVTDLIHLVAELLENAAAFSPPDTTVTLRAKSTADGGAEIVIVDTGIGMSAEALIDANRQLAAPMSIDVSAAERMGHVVVGHLAKRHHIGVALSHGNPGVTVRVRIPATLVSAAPAEQEETIEPARFLRAGVDPSTTAETPIVTAGNGRAPTMRVASMLRQRNAGGQSVWWSKEAGIEQSAQTPLPTEPSPEAVGVTSAGLPKRNRTTTKAVAVAVTVEVAEAAEANPEDTASILSSLYAGVRRAESEDTAPVT
jgi:signal transduction histidine kinase